MTNKHKRILRIIFQSVITGVFVVFGLFYFSSISMMPDLRMFSNELSSMLFALFVSYVGLIYILARFCSKNVKKWEIILYNILNIIFVILIMVIFYKLTEVIPKILENNNPYDPLIQPEEYDYYYEECEYAMMGPMIIYVFCLMYTPFLTLLPVALSILSMIFGLKKQVQPVLVSNQTAPEVYTNKSEVKVESEPAI